MVTVIMGLVVMTVLPALAILRDSNQASLTQSNLRSLMLATAAFVQANGCLPCPAVPGGSGTNFGKLGSATACGACNGGKQMGIPPFAALGLPASVAHDGWGNWITMRVDSNLAGLTPVVPPASNKGLCAAGLSPADKISVTVRQGATQSAAVIFISHGKDGYGAYIAEPLKTGIRPFPGTGYAECSAYTGFAKCNANKNTNQFYDLASYTDSADTYDDVLAFADRNVLVSMLGTASCSTTW